MKESKESYEARMAVEEFVECCIHAPDKWTYNPVAGLELKKLLDAYVAANSGCSVGRPLPRSVRWFTMTYTTREEYMNEEGLRRAFIKTEGGRYPSLNPQDWAVDAAEETVLSFHEFDNEEDFLLAGGR